jgi:hypothetical protein
MSFDRYAGMASAIGLVVIWAILAWLGVADRYGELIGGHRPNNGLGLRAQYLERLQRL